jgi:two-component system heavy metal sensor histidine kinase CusS
MHGGEVDAASGAHGTVVGITLRAPEGHATADNITKS